MCEIWQKALLAEAYRFCDWTQESLTVIKRLAGIKWGCGRETLNKTYNSYVKSLICYCNEALIAYININIF